MMETHKWLLIYFYVDKTCLVSVTISNYMGVLQFRIYKGSILSIQPHKWLTFYHSHGYLIIRMTYCTIQIFGKFGKLS